MCVCTHECSYPWRPEEGIASFADAMGSCELPGMCSGTLTLVLWKNSKCSYPLRNLLSLLFSSYGLTLLVGGKSRQRGQQGFHLVLLESLLGRKPSVWLNTMNRFSNQTNMELSPNRIQKGKNANSKAEPRVSSSVGCVLLWSQKSARSLWAASKANTRHAESLWSIHLLFLCPLMIKATFPILFDSCWFLFG